MPRICRGRPAVVVQGQLQPLNFFSKKLSGVGSRYFTFDRELQAAFSAFRHFRLLLQGRHFCLLSDHRPLIIALVSTPSPWSARQQRQLSFIAELTADIQHTPVQETVVADALQNTISGSYPRQNSSPAPTTLMEELLLARLVLSFQLPQVEGTGHSTCSWRPPNRLNL